MRSNSRRNASSSLAAAVFLAVCLAVGWVWLVASTHLHEMIVGVGVVVLSTAFLLAVRRSQPPAIELHREDLVQAWHIPWYMASGVWEITLVFLRDLFAKRPAGSFFRVCGFKAAKRNRRAVAREALATIYTTTAPNFIILGIDPDLSRMLFHQLERSGIPKMTQSLGAQPGAQR